MQIHFVVGTGRCGSSILHEILARHCDVAFLSNLDDRVPRVPFIGRFNNSLYHLSRGAWTKKGAARFAPSEGYRVITQQVSQVYENSSRDLLASDVTPWLQRRFQQFFAERFRAQSRPVFIHKYTGWPRIGFFNRIFPDARFVHVVRDGRAVANSWLQMQWWGGYRGPEHWQWGGLPQGLMQEWQCHQRSFVALAGLCWRHLMDEYAAAAVQLPTRQYLVVRYEDILTAPTESIRAIATFLGLRWSDRLARATREVAVGTARRNAFETDLSPDQLRMLTQIAEPVLKQYGYM